MNDDAEESGDTRLRNALGDYRIQGNRVELFISPETLQQLGKVVRDAATEGVTSGLTVLAANEEIVGKVFSTGLKVIRTSAQTRAGNLVLGGLSEITRKALLALILAGVLWSMVGWTGIATIWAGVKMAFASTPLAK